MTLAASVPSNTTFSLSAHHPHTPTASFFTLRLASSSPASKVSAAVKVFCQPASAVLSWSLPQGNSYTWELLMEGPRPLQSQEQGRAMMETVRSVAVDAIGAVDFEVDVNSDVRVQRFEPEVRSNICLLMRGKF